MTKFANTTKMIVIVIVFSLPLIVIFDVNPILSILTSIAFVNLILNLQDDED